MQAATNMRGRISTPTALKLFFLAGNAIFTCVSKKTGTRYTYRFSRPKSSDKPIERQPVFVAVLTRPDHFDFVGTIWRGPNGPYYSHGRKAGITSSAPSVQAAMWIVKFMDDPEPLLTQAEFWHEGRCGRCMRALTVPSSIQSGYGPECINHVMGVAA